MASCPECGSELIALEVEAGAKVCALCQVDSEIRQDPKARRAREVQSKIHEALARRRKKG